MIITYYIYMALLIRTLDGVYVRARFAQMKRKRQDCPNVIPIPLILVFNVQDVI